MKIWKKFIIIGSTVMVIAGTSMVVVGFSSVFDILTKFVLFGCLVCLLLLGYCTFYFGFKVFRV